MVNCLRSHLRPFSLLLIVLLCGLFGNMPVARAEVQFLESPSGRMLVRSHNQVRDEADRPWQLTVLKDPQPTLQPPLLLLQLTPPPPLVAAPDRALTLRLADGAQLTAPAVPQRAGLDPALPTAATQYDLTPVIARVPPDAGLTLIVPGQTDAVWRLRVEASAVQEWITVSDCEALMCARP
jgi:hypothetical protein